MVWLSWLMAAASACSCWRCQVSTYARVSTSVNSPKSILKHTDTLGH